MGVSLLRDGLVMIAKGFGCPEGYDLPRIKSFRVQEAVGSILVRAGPPFYFLQKLVVLQILVTASLFVD